MLVFLLKHPQTKVFELDFGFDFCQKWTEEFWQCKINYISEETRIGELKDREDVLFFMLDPLCVPSPRANFLLKAALDTGYDLAVPVSNESIYDLQKAKVPYIYHNLSTFCEVADIMSTDAEIIPTDKIDPFLFAVKSKVLKEDIRIKDIPQLPLKKGVVKAAFVHRFGDVFSAPRDDLIALIPANVKKILDIGCAEGGFGKNLKQIRQDIKITGIELSPSLAKKAKAFYDKIIIGNVETIEIDEEFDLVNCGDIIEHLYNPWQLLRRINSWLKKGGYLIGSVPNAGHWSLVRDLLEGRFEYIPIGLLCIGHIRFFTEDSLKEMLKEAGFDIEIWLKQKFPPSPQGKAFLEKIKQCQLGNLESLTTFSFQFRARKVETS